MPETQIKKIDEALSSHYSKEILAKEFMLELEKGVKHVKNRINSTITNPEMKAKLMEERALIYLVDYHNQFHFSKNSKIENFLVASQNEKGFDAGKIASWVLEETDYGKRFPKKIKTRHFNIEKSCKEFF